MVSSMGNCLEIETSLFLLEEAKMYTNVPSDNVKETSSSIFSISIICFIECISSVPKELPSENDVLKIGPLKIPNVYFDRTPAPKITNIDIVDRKINHLVDTEAQIPIDMVKKYIASSNGDFTGFLNLTIESAPTRPKDRARLLEITEVIENVMIGRIISVTE